ncbi:hypothetical protein GGX14DRAFT_559766 [Mycena pura]|uniref:Uncharacterized protein n=1 Tax=Mycena pura TaxID=153505 RepID=A0AAD6VWJ0_9AGAR|nr:hypothetical protein GGX14DRAFT_559766 [Mycena pura]
MSSEESYPYCADHTGTTLPARSVDPVHGYYRLPTRGNPEHQHSPDGSAQLLPCVDADVHMRDVNNDNDDDVDDDVNAKTVPNTIYPTPRPTSSSVPAVSPAYAATDYAALLPDEKTNIMHSLIQRGRLHGTALRELVKLHEGVSPRGANGKKTKTAQEMVAHFLEHRCTDICLVGIKLAQAGGLNTACISDESLSSSATFLKLRTKTRGPYNKRKRQSGTDDSNTSKRQKIGPPQDVLHIPSPTQANDAPEYDPFRILTWEEKAQIMNEYKCATSKQALLRVDWIYRCWRQPSPGSETYAVNRKSAHLTRLPSSMAHMFCVRPVDEKSPTPDSIASLSAVTPTVSEPDLVLTNYEILHFWKSSASPAREQLDACSS